MFRVVETDIKKVKIDHEHESSKALDSSIASLCGLGVAWRSLCDCHGRQPGVGESLAESCFPAKVRCAYAAGVHLSGDLLERRTDGNDWIQ
jgi:hypothetical protein